MAALNGYLALGTMNAAGIFTEISGAAGYARQAITLEAATYGKMRNTNAIAFPKNSSAEWPAYDAYAVYDKATGGSVQFAWQVARERGIYAGNRARPLSPGSIEIGFPVATSNEGSEVVLSKPFLWTPGGLQRFEEAPITLGSVQRELREVAEASLKGGKFSLPLGATVVTLGSSTPQRNTEVTATSVRTQRTGILQQQRSLSPVFGYANYLDAGDPLGRGWSGANRALAGTQISSPSTGSLTNQIDLLLASPSRYWQAWDVYAGTNDIGDTKTAKQAFGLLVAQIERLLGTGKPGFLRTLNPRGLTGASALALDSIAWQRRIDFNNMVREYVARQSMIELIDSVELISPTATWREEVNPLFTNDGLHMNSLGSAVAALAGDQVYRRVFAWSSDVYSGLVKGADLFDNWQLAGTGGVASAGLGVTGVAPDKTRIAASGQGATSCVTSVVEGPDGYNAIQYTYTLTNETTVRRYSTTLTDTPSTSNSSIACPPEATGKWVQIHARYRVLDGADNLRGLHTLLSCRNASVASDNRMVTYGMMNTAVADASVIPTQLKGRDLYIPSDPIFVPDGTTHLFAQLNADIAGNGSLVVQASQPRITYADDPRWL